MILDSNALSAIADGDPNLEPVLTKASESAIPLIAFGEYRYGIAQSRIRLRYEKWLKELVLHVDEGTAASTHPFAAN